MYNVTSSFLAVTQDKRIDLQRKQTNRSVFQCHVIGPRGVGKTAFLQGFLGRNLNYVATLSKDHLSPFVTNTVPVYGQEKYLVVSLEVDPHNFLFYYGNVRYCFSFMKSTLALD